MGSGYQSITITETPRRRSWLRASLFVALLLPLAWSIGRQERDYYASYSGVVVQKGMDCRLCFLGRRNTLDLYIVLQDASGKRTKRYVGNDISFHNVSRWNEIAVGTYVVKDKGYGFPYVPGQKAAMAQLEPSFFEAHPWVFAGLLVAMLAALAVKLRQLWKTL